MKMTDENFLADYSENEKTAFIGTLASLAIADNVATNDEVETISALAEESGLSEINKIKVTNVAKGKYDEELDAWLQILKNSELRYSLVAELISFARSDGHYNDQEKQKIEEISSRLGINSQQFSVLDNFSSGSEEGNVTKAFSSQGTSGSAGLGEMFKKAGLSMSGVSKGLIAIAAPMLLAKLFGSRLGGLSGMKSAAGGMLGTAGLTSLLGMLSGGRGFSSAGGLLSKILKR